MRCIRCTGAITAILLGAAHAAAGEVTGETSGEVAGEVTVRVENVRNGVGSVLVALCSPEAFLTLHCDHRGRAKARKGGVAVTVDGVPPGSYAVQAIHDENENRDLDRDLFGLPREGLAISRDAPMRMGPPRFADAAVRIGAGGGSVTLRMRYF